LLENCLKEGRLARSSSAYLAPYENTNFFQALTSGLHIGIFRARMARKVYGQEYVASDIR
jgi:hypothetical protein